MIVINNYVTQATGPTEPAWSGAPGFIGNGTYTQAAANLSLDVPYPASISYNDILILSVIGTESTSGTPTINVPSGWTQINQLTIGTNALNRTGIFWKRADGTETGTVNVTFAGTLNASGEGKAGIICNYRGCLSTGTPYEAAASNAAVSTTPTGSSVTTTGPDRKVLTIIAKALSNADANCTPAAGWTEQYEFSATSPTITGHAIHDKTVASAGTESAEAATNASVRWATVSLALLPR